MKSEIWAHIRLGFSIGPRLEAWYARWAPRQTLAEKPGPSLRSHRCTCRLLITEIAHEAQFVSPTLAIARKMGRNHGSGVRLSL